jgi:membrane protein
VGAVVTAGLFSIGKYLLGLYLAQSGTASAFGAAGSLVVLLVWVYYSSQIVLFGAEVTRTIMKRSGRQIRASGNAVLVEEPSPSLAA